MYDYLVRSLWCSHCFQILWLRTIYLKYSRRPITSKLTIPSSSFLWRISVHFRDVGLYQTRSYDFNVVCLNFFRSKFWCFPFSWFNTGTWRWFKWLCGQGNYVLKIFTFNVLKKCSRWRCSCYSRTWGTCSWGFFLQALSDAPNECATCQTDINSLSRV